MFYTTVDELAYRIFGNFFYKNKEKFQNLKAKIRQSHISISVDQYLASACMYSLIAGLIGVTFGGWLGLKIFGYPISRLSLFMSSINVGFVESHLYPRRTTNYFAIPQERRAEAMSRARRVLNLG